MTETAIIQGLEVGRETLMPCEASTVAVAILGSLRENSAVAVGHSAASAKRELKDIKMQEKWRTIPDWGAQSAER
jgi:hypothetical protein